MTAPDNASLANEPRPTRGLRPLARMRGKREALARWLTSPWLRPLRRLRPRPALLALTYHRVGPLDDLDDGLVSASLEEFTWQMSWLKAHVRVLDGRELGAVVEGQLRLTEPAVVLTFDDGYADNLPAARLLARTFELPAFFFLTTGFVGTARIPQWDRVAHAVKCSRGRSLHVPAIAGRGPFSSGAWSATEASATARLTQRQREVKQWWRSIPTADGEAFVVALEQAVGASAEDVKRDRPLFMTWDEARELCALGHSVGAHTHSHPILSNLSAARQQEELLTSKRTLETELGVPINWLAYPVGERSAFTLKTRVLAMQCGFRAAFSYYGGWNDPARLDRADLRRLDVAPTLSRELFQAQLLFPELLASVGS